MIRSLFLRNAGPFRGEHTLTLGSKAYAITARYESDPGRSNWGGKSFLLEMVDFALTGRLAKHRRYDADGWISRGERDGAVCLTLEDGTSILRERRRGQATQVRFGSAAAGGGATQDEATAAMQRYLGFDADDFRNIAYFEQKQMARLVLTEPEKRLDIVRGWFGLGRAERAEERAGEEAADALREAASLRARAEALEASAPEVPVSADEYSPDQKISAFKIFIKQEEQMLAEVDARAAQAARDRDTIAEYERIVGAGKSVAEHFGKIDPGLEAKIVAARAAWTAAVGAHAEAMSALGLKRRVAQADFDGRCPVAEIECPARAKINEDQRAARAAHARADAAEREARERRDEASRALADLEIVEKQATRLREQLASLREEAREILPTMREAAVRLKESKDETELREDLVASIERRRVMIVDATRERDVAAFAKAQREKSLAEAARLRARLDEVARAAAVATRARGIFRAVQRRVAERALEAINRSASAMLADGGIDLDVALRWEREGKGPAKQCEECGAAFPASARVKACPACGAARGLLVVQRLEFAPSDRSGAADDVAGVALQLAAGSWFLASRGSPWATLLIDEPFSACDRVNRGGMAKIFVKLLQSRSMHYRQAFVISHTADTVDMFPGKIEIVVGTNGERAIRST